MKNLLKFIHYFLIAVLLIIVFISLYIMYSQVFLGNYYATLFGIGRNIITDDLDENFKKGDYIITLSSDKYNIGDMVVYTTLNGDIFTDTIIEISDDEIYHFKNEIDKNNVVFKHFIKGKVIFTIRGIGDCVLWIESPYGTITIFMIIILIIEIPHLIELLIEKKRSKSML